MNLAGQNITVFDCEIKNVIDGKEIGWKDYAKMGLSISSSFNFKTMDYKIYFDDNLSEFKHDLESADLVTGFNIKQFDIPLIKAFIPDLNLDPKKIYDLLEESRRGLGNNFAKGLKLDDHLQGTFGKDGMKSGDGANAPLLWQQGKYGELSSYVLRDVKCEAKLFRYAWEHGYVKTPMHGPITIRNPQLLMGAA